MATTSIYTSCIRNGWNALPVEATSSPDRSIPDPPEVVRRLASSEPPTGLACANERGLLGALHAVGRRGLEPGRDVHIVTRDNTRLARFLPVKVGVHSVDMADVGHKLIKVLESRIANPLGPVATILLQGRFDPAE